MGRVRESDWKREGKREYWTGKTKDREYEQDKGDKSFTVKEYSSAPKPGQNTYVGPNASTAGAGRGGRDAGEVGKKWSETFLTPDDHEAGAMQAESDRSKKK